MDNSLTHTLKDLLVSCKVGASNLACRHEDVVITRHKDEVITNIMTQGQTYIKSSQVKCIQIHSLLPHSFIRYFNNQISTIFSKSSKPFLFKNVLHQLSQLSKHLKIFQYSIKSMNSILKNLVKDASLFLANKSCISPYAIRNMMHFQCLMHFP